jgi:hypothetical protein
MGVAICLFLWGGSVYLDHWASFFFLAEARPGCLYHDGSSAGMALATSPVLFSLRVFQFGFSFRWLLLWAWWLQRALHGLKSRRIILGHDARHI